MNQKQRVSIAIGLLFLQSYLFKYISCQQVKCNQDDDCSSSTQCCIQGLCSKITDSTIQAQCNTKKLCTSSQCQYGCCNSDSNCGSYNDCQDDQRKIQIIISIVVGCVVFLLLACYLFTVCKKRKRSEIMPESQSHIEAHENDGTFINQTNINQTQMLMLNGNNNNNNNNNNQTNLTEQNQNNQSAISKPTHVLPPIQTIFLIDQNQNQPIFVQRKLDMNEVDSINKSIQGTRLSKEYFNRKKKNRQSQRENSLNQSNILQSSMQDQRRSQDEQFVSFSRIEEQNTSQLANQIQRQRDNQLSSVQGQGQQKGDLLKNPDNYLYQILRQMREQVSIKKNKNCNRQDNGDVVSHDKRQLRSETDLTLDNTRERKKIVSLHNKLSDRNKYNHNNMDQESYSYNQESLQSAATQENLRFIKKEKKRSISRKYQQEIQISRNINETELQQQQQQLQQQDRDEQIDIQYTPHQDTLMITPHTANDNSHRQLNSPIKTYQHSIHNPQIQNNDNNGLTKNKDNNGVKKNNNSEQSRNSIQQNNLLQILQNQIISNEELNQNNQDVITKSSKNVRKIERKSQTSNDEDIIKQINNIYGDDDYNILQQNAQQTKFEQNAYHDLNRLEQRKSQDISDSVYEIEKQIDYLSKDKIADDNENINSQKQKEIESRFSNGRDISIQNNSSQKLESEINDKKRDDHNLETQNELKDQRSQNQTLFKLQQLTINQSNLRDSVSQHPRILTLSQIQDNQNSNQ